MSSVTEQPGLLAHREPNRAAQSERVIDAMKAAAARTSSDFAYLLHTAGIESGLAPNARSKASSATGLFQFTEQTWLHLVKSYGEKLGLGGLAQSIEVDGRGTAHINDSAVRQNILDLRTDPEIAAEMACQLGKLNGETLRQKFGGTIGSAELYLAHFLGAGGASVFLRALHGNPQAKAADLMPAAAEANASIFYGAGGEPRSVEQIYQHFARIFEQKPANLQEFTPTVELESAKLSTPQSPLAATAQVEAVRQTADTLPVAGKVTPDTVSQFAALMLNQMNMADVASMIALDDEDQGTLSLLA